MNFWGMEEPSVCVNPATEGRVVTPDSPSRIRSTMSTPKSPSGSSDDCEAPEYKCAICLGRLRNKSLIDSCFHEFCFECLVEWSKIKPECPLCKTKFDYIVHNVRSNDDYEKYHCQSSQRDNDLQIPWVEHNRSFRYRTTMTPHLQERLAMQQIVALREHSTASSRRGIPRRYPRNSQRVPDFRSQVYRENLWVQPLSDVTNRFRECSPSFYRENPAQVYRLVRWLQRELMVLLPMNCPHRTFVMQTIINNVFQHPIRSSFFATQLQPYLGPNTRHFIHEFAEYARSPFDMTGHDRAATYLSHGPTPPIEEVVLNSPTSSEFSVDDLDELPDSSGSDVEIIEDNNNTLPALPVAGPSGVRSVAPRRSRRISGPIMPLSNEETHEIISSSSSDECEVIGTFKPPTPEVINILSSDDDTPVLNDENTPSFTVDQERISPSPNERVSQSAEERTSYSLEDSQDQPRLSFKIEPGRIRQRLKRRKYSHSEERWSSSSSEKASSDSRQNSSSSRDLAVSKSESYGRHGRIPSVVVPQPSFKMDASSSRFLSNNEEASEVEGEFKEKSKKKKNKHSKKHKRSHRYVEEEDRGEGTSGSGSSRRCKVCRHRHCKCNRESSRKYKKIKGHFKESNEEWESTSGSSRSKKTKRKKHSQIRYSDCKYSDSSD